jgi:hypothetical protein
MAVVPAGWGALADAGDYYPDDLPEDWQLAYFANEHSGLYLPLAGWTNLPAATLSSWREDVHAGFAFYLEWPASESARAGVARTALADNLAGWVHWHGAGGEPGELLAPEAADATSPPLGQALRCPPALLADLRAGARWLRAQAAAASITLIVLPRPTAAQLADWQRLAPLLGFDVPGARRASSPA